MIAQDLNKLYSYTGQRECSVNVISTADMNIIRYYVSITSTDVQSNTTSLTNIFIDLGLHVSIH